MNKELQAAIDRAIAEKRTALVVKPQIGNVYISGCEGETVISLVKQAVDLAMYSRSVTRYVAVYGGEVVAMITGLLYESGGHNG